MGAPDVLPSALPLDLDVLVVGAGTAGATLGAWLSPRFRVAVVGREQPAGRIIGESLPAAARVPLTELGLWSAFEAQGHRPAQTKLSLWGGEEIVSQHAVMDPHGTGWHLDRRRFESLLRDAARAQGARLVQPARLLRFGRVAAAGPRRWRCEIETPGGLWSPSCRFLVDATGRSAWLTRRAGGSVSAWGKLVCLHTAIRAEDARLHGATVVESTPDGWWYSADLPDGSSVLAWHGDGDLEATARLRTADDLLGFAAQTRLAGPRSRAARPLEPMRRAPAFSQRAVQACGRDWLAIGDASLAFDPLASQGLLHGLITGVQGGRAIAADFGGDEEALPQWASYLRHIGDAYGLNLMRCYAMERRWPDASFWRRRHDELPPPRTRFP